jgi:hypothetical protein
MTAMDIVAPGAKTNRFPHPSRAVAAEITCPVLAK